MYNSNKLWYHTPAELWEDALPVGNGRIGAMIYGGINDEIIKLNEDTLWSGYPKDKNNHNSKEYLGVIRQNILERKLDTAHELTNLHMLGQWTEAYLPLGNILFHFNHSDKVMNYRRELDLQTATTTTEYACDGVNYKREIFCSNPAQVIVIHLQASKKALSFEMIMESPLYSTSSVHEQDLILHGKAPAVDLPDYYNIENPIQYTEQDNTISFESRIHILDTDGTVKSKHNSVILEDASEVVLLVAMATSFVSFDQVPNANASMRCHDYISVLTKSTYHDLYQEHLLYYSPIFNRMDINLGLSRDDVTTDKRIIDFYQGIEDPGLCALFFQYNRYLLISSSCPGSQAANLQGIWNQEVRPPWSSNYTLNINAEMNYWLSETCNLSEFTKPLFDLIEHLSKNGRKTAMLHYNCNGWVSHHNSDLWAQTAPVGPLPDDHTFGDCTGYSVWPMSSGWLCRHLWDHYLFTGDEGFLRDRAMPIILDACRFYIDYLIEDTDQTLVTGLSISPENTYELNGTNYHLDKMPAMDIAILHELFTMALAGIEITGIGTEFKDQCHDILNRLPEYKIGSEGQLLEWSKEYVEPELHHRHSSHLYGLYPSQEISPIKTPKLAKACEVSLLRRGLEGTGWGQAWKICLWARLYDKEKCYDMLKQIMRPATSTGYNYSDGSGIYKNMFDAHPPFQIDGNFGASAGIAEMLIQSEPGFIHLLPALPSSFHQGYSKGLCCRGCITSDLYFHDNHLDYAVLTSRKPQSVTIRYEEKEIMITLSEDQPFMVNRDLFSQI